MTSTSQVPVHQPPGPKSHPIFGVLPDYSRDPLDFVSQSAREYGDVVLWKSPLFSAYLLNHPDYIEEVLVTNSSQFGKTETWQIFRRLLGNGLVSSDRFF